MRKNGNKVATQVLTTFFAVAAVSGTLSVLFNCSNGEPARSDAATPVPDSVTPDSVTPDSVTPDSSTPDQGGPVPGAWVTIPAGTFTMGSPTSEPCRDTNEDQHQVTLTRSFELQSTEVTQGEFQALMGYNPSYFSSCGSNCPVEFVTWHEAVAYCNALSAQKGLAQCYTCTGSGANVSCSEASAYSGQKVYDCPGYRLPTEAEWEYAYRAGTQTAYYSGANDLNACICQGDAKLDPIAWYCGNSGVSYAGCHDASPSGGPACAGTHPVGQKLPNAWFLYDMAGNVWEWCHDWRMSLGSSATKDPFGSASGSSRVLRGGSWSRFAYYSRAADRYDIYPSYRIYYIGFRCSRTNVDL